MNESANNTSMLSTFLKGAGSGAFSGGTIMGIFWVVGSIAAASSLIPSALVVGIPAMLLTTTCTSLFGGVMAVKRSMETTADVRQFSTAPRPSPAEEAAPAIAMSQSIPTPALAEEADMASARTSSWADRPGISRSTDSIRQILDNGAMSDKDRASAILAAREATANHGPTI
jgi:hypothetical protein